MERITFHSRSTKKKGIQVVFRLRDGRDIQITHKSDIIADLVDLNKLNPNGTPKDRVSIYNEELSKSLKNEFEIMTSAYAYMCGEGLDITSEVFEREIARIKSPVIAAREETPSLIKRFRKYADDAFRYGIVGEARYKHITIVADKLERFLLINGISAIIPSEFTETHLMDFREFIFNEYEYVEKFPKMYEKMSNRNKPSERLSMNTVASQLKMLQTFMNE